MVFQDTNSKRGCEGQLPGARRPEVLAVPADGGEERRVVDSTAALTRAERELLHLAKMGW